MELTSKQVGVLNRMALAMFTAIFVILSAIILDPFNYAQVSLLEDRATVLGLSLILPTMMLIVSIGRLAKFRFFSQDDIDGSGLTSRNSASYHFAMHASKYLRAIGYRIRCVYGVVFVDAFRLVICGSCVFSVIFYRTYLLFQRLQSWCTSKGFWFCDNLLFNGSDVLGISDHPISLRLKLVRRVTKVLSASEPRQMNFD